METSGILEHSKREAQAVQTSENIRLLEHRLAEAAAQLATTEAAHRAREKKQAFLLELSVALRPILDARDILGVDRAMYAEVDGALGAETGTIHAQFVRPSANDGRATVGVSPPVYLPSVRCSYNGRPLPKRAVDRNGRFERSGYWTGRVPAPSDGLPQ
ncbi:hypothetical protein GCM10010924_60250 [Rhizobium wenxiniae]|nr:hypothetical protein GCM10010924_60250 [Rhizobium wenxiniae]